MGVDRVDDHGKEYLAGEEPDDDEHAEENVAGLSVTKVLEQLRSLASVSAYDGQKKNALKENSPEVRYRPDPWCRG